MKGSKSATDLVNARTGRRDLDPRFHALFEAILKRAEPKGWLKRLLIFIWNAPTSASTSPPLSSVLETHDPRHVSVIVEQIRRTTETQLAPYYSRAVTWVAGVDRRLVQSALLTDASAAYALMTIWSGHTREQAVHSIATVPGAFCLALLVYRLNDWVAQVRVATEQTLFRMRDGLEAAKIVGSVEFLWEFNRVGRASASARELVESLTTRPDVIHALRKEALEGTTDRSLRIVRRLLRTSTLDTDLVDMATNSPHSRIRAIATRAMLARSYNWRDGKTLHQRVVDQKIDPAHLARLALADPAIVVQLAGLEYMVEHGQTWEDRQAILLRYASHGSNSLSELAQWALNKAGVDWLTHLRDRLLEPRGPNHRVAYTLGRHGNAEDGNRICALAADLTDEVALPLLGASARQGIDEAIDRLRRIALTASDLQLARRASTALRDAQVTLDADALKQAANSGDVFFMRGLGRHFSSQGAGAQLNILARLELAQANIDVPTWFVRVQRKVNRGAFTMSEEERTDLQHLLRDAPKTRELAQRRLAIGT